MEGNAYKVKAKDTCKGAVIFMHGLGDSGEGWSQVQYFLRDETIIKKKEFKQRMAKYRPDVTFIFPNAPTAPVTLNMGMRMPSWFDIKGLDENAAEDKEVLYI